MNKLYLAALGIFGSVAIANPIFAFSFTSDLTSSNWQSSGDVLRTATTASLSNALKNNGDNDLVNLNFTGTNPTQAGQPVQSLESFLGVSVGFLDIGGQAQEGSAIRQTFTAAAGEIISFNLSIPNFDSSDLIFVLFNGSLTTFTTNSNVSRTLRAGTNDIAIGVVDITDSTVSSQVVVNNVAFTPIPFEFSPALGLGLLGVWGVGTKLRKKKSRDAMLGCSCKPESYTR
jgi:hypothetical protein